MKRFGKAGKAVPDVFAGYSIQTTAENRPDVHCILVTWLILSFAWATGLAVLLAGMFSVLIYLRLDKIQRQLSVKAQGVVQTIPAKPLMKQSIVPPIKTSANEDSRFVPKGS